jgi:biotin operon repressor
MNNKEQSKYREDYEYSPLFAYTKENITIEGNEWSKLYTPVLFDIELTMNDKATYLAILSKCYKVGHKTKKNKDSEKREEVYKAITQKELGEITSISSKNIHRSISRLRGKGYILERLGSKSITYHLIEMIKEDGSEEAFLPIPIEYFLNLGQNRRLFIDYIKVLLLSWGNDKLPTRASCLNRFSSLSKKEYYKLKEIHNGLSDVSIYENLINVEILNEEEDISLGTNKFIEELNEIFKTNEEVQDIIDEAREVVIHEIKDVLQVKQENKVVELPIEDNLIVKGSIEELCQMMGI